MSAQLGQVYVPPKLGLDRESQVEVQSSRRADIQLLRGVAVLAVMLAHFGSVLPAGFIGVDLFFAISGFVITLSFVRLSQAAQSPTEVLKAFWLRRFWRLAPSLSIVLTFVILTSLALLPPQGFFDQLKMSGWSTFFAGNIGVEVISRADYFNPASGENWLLHLWSLGVEEQFYLFFPLIFLAFLTRMSLSASVERTRLLVWALVLMSFLLASLNELEIMISGTTVLSDSTGFSALLGYYSPLTRAWQFGLGILAALSSIGANDSNKAHVQTFLGAGLVVTSLLFTPESALLPGPLTLMPMIGMYLLLRWPLHERWTYSATGRLLGWLGDRSYSAYLWHWPVWAVIGEFMSPSTPSIILALASTFALAHVSYEKIELPFIAIGRVFRVKKETLNHRLRETQSPQAAWLLALPLLLTTGILGAYISLSSAGEVLERQEVSQIDEAIDCRIIDCASSEIDVLLIGDSHAGALANQLNSRLAEEGLSLAGFVQEGCLHLPNDEIVSIEGGCNLDRKEVERILDASNPSTVVLFGYTVGRFTTTNSGGDQEIYLINRRTGERVSDSTGPKSYELALLDTLSIFSSRNIQTVIVSGVPDFSFRPEEVTRFNNEATMLQSMLSSQNSTSGETISKSSYLARQAKFLTIDERITATSPLIRMVNGWDELCAPTTCSQISQDGQYLFSDQDHLASLGAKKIAEAVTLSIRTFE